MLKMQMVYLAVFLNQLQNNRFIANGKYICQFVTLCQFSN